MKSTRIPEKDTQTHRRKSRVRTDRARIDPETRFTRGSRSVRISHGDVKKFTIQLYEGSRGRKPWRIQRHSAFQLTEGSAAFLHGEWPMQVYMAINVQGNSTRRGRRG